MIIDIKNRGQLERIAIYNHEQALQKAILAGQALFYLKKLNLGKKGVSWKDYVEANLPFATRSADRYINIYKNAKKYNLLVPSNPNQPAILKSKHKLMPMTEVVKLHKVGYTHVDRTIIRAFTSLVRSEVYIEAKGLCDECGKFCTLDDYDCDHITPYSRGGESIKANARCLCKNCNRSNRFNEEVA